MIRMMHLSFSRGLTIIVGMSTWFFRRSSLVRSPRIPRSVSGKLSDVSEIAKEFRAILGFRSQSWFKSSRTPETPWIRMASVMLCSLMAMLQIRKCSLSWSKSLKLLFDIENTQKELFNPSTIIIPVFPVFVEESSIGVVELFQQLFWRRVLEEAYYDPNPVEILDLRLARTSSPTMQLSEQDVLNLPTRREREPPPESISPRLTDGGFQKFSRNPSEKIASVFLSNSWSFLVRRR